MPRKPGRATLQKRAEMADALRAAEEAIERVASLYDEDERLLPGQTGDRIGMMNLVLMDDAERVARQFAVRREFIEKDGGR